MSYDVRHYRLPDEATRADRLTLATWKAWVTWVRPLLLATIVMSIVSAVVGTFIAKSGGFVAVWSPANYAPAVPVGGATLAEINGPLWTKGIVAQLASVVAAAAAVWPVLRRSPRPVPVGALAGLFVVAVHLTVSNQWDLEPIVAAPASYQAAALLSLWLLPVVAAGVGAASVRRARKGSS